MDCMNIINNINNNNNNNNNNNINEIKNTYQYQIILSLVNVHNNFIINNIIFFIKSNLAILYKKVLLNKLIKNYITFSNVYSFMNTIKFNNIDIYNSLFVNNNINNRNIKHKLFIDINKFLLSNNTLEINNLYISICNNLINYKLEDIYNIFILDVVKCIVKSSLSFLYKKIILINYLSEYMNDDNEKLIYNFIKNNDEKLYKKVSNNYEIFRYNKRRKDYLDHLYQNINRSRNYYKNNKNIINKKRNKFKINI